MMIEIYEITHLLICKKGSHNLRQDAVTKLLNMLETILKFWSKKIVVSLGPRKQEDKSIKNSLDIKTDFVH